MTNDAAGDAGVWDSIVGSMNNFASTAAAGGFAVSETGGQAMLTAIRRMQDWYDGRMNDLQRLELELPLGDSHGARVVKPFNVQVATDQQGFLTQLRAFRESLDKAAEGITKAMENYHATDHGEGQRFQRT